MCLRSLTVFSALLLIVAAGLTAQSRTMPVDEVRPGMRGIGRTVFEGERLDDFTVEIIGTLRNAIGPRRDLILARLDGGPIAKAGVIAGMSGSPVYIDGRLIGAVSYSLGEFAKEPIAGITPIAEMRESATLPGPRLRAARVELQLPVTQESLRASLAQAFSWVRPFADSPNDVRVLGGSGVSAGIGTMLRPIATPLSFSGFDASIAQPIMAAFRDAGFVTVLAGSGLAGGAGGQNGRSNAPLRPGDPVGVGLMNGDLEIGATGTITDIDGDHVYAFGHPFYGLGPTQFPMTRAYIHTVLPSLNSSQKIASTGEVIGTVSQDRAPAIAGTLGAGPAMIPITLTLNSERGTRKSFTFGMVNDQLLTPLLAYTSILNTLQSYERQNGVATYALRGAARVKNHGQLAFEDLYTGDQPSASAAASVVAPLNVLLRNSFESLEFEGLNFTIEASEQPRSATLERVWVDGTRIKAGATVDLRVLLRTYRGDELTRSIPIQIPANARGTVSVMVADGVRLSQWEARELQVQPLQARGVPQMLNVLNRTRKSNRLYVRLITRDGGAVVKGEPLAALPASVLAVIEADRSGGGSRPLQSALVGEWDITVDHAVNGSRTLTIPLEE